MSIIDKLKDLKEQLPKITTEKVQKENSDFLKDKIDTNLEITEETPHHPCIGPAKEDYICLNTFSACFEKAECFIRPDQIFTVTKPDYDISSNSKTELKFKISFTMIDAKHYFGKPSEYTNFKSDQEIIDLIKEFNQDPPEWFELTEYGDNSNSVRITTRFWEPRITRIEFPEFNTMTEGIIKYYTATISCSKMISVKGDFKE